MFPAKPRTWAEDQSAKARAALAKAAPESASGLGALNALTRLRRYSDDLSNGFTIRPPNLVFDDRLPLDLGDLTVRLRYVGRAHKEGDTLVFIPEERLLMIGDLAFDTSIAAQAEGGRYEGTWEPARWLSALDEVFNGGSGVAHVVKGHAAIETGEWLAVRRQYLRRLRDGVRAAKARGTTSGQRVMECAAPAALP